MKTLLRFIGLLLLMYWIPVFVGSVVFIIVPDLYIGIGYLFNRFIVGLIIIAILVLIALLWKLASELEKEGNK